jgi:hypothetical protein
MPKKRFGAEQIIGRLLGHTQATTTARSAHLDNDPLRHASEVIGGSIAAALHGKGHVSVVSFRRSAVTAIPQKSGEHPHQPQKVAQ